MRCPNARRVRTVLEAIRGRFGGGAIGEATSVRSAAVRVVTASETYPGSVHEAERVWYDISLWPRFIDGLDSVEEVTPNWPGVGAEVRWRSGPAGRGQVVERVVSYELLDGQEVEVQDDSIRGHQRILFTPENGNVTVELSLSYALKGRSPLMALIDLLFIRRAMTTSLQSTLHRFGAELEAARSKGVG
jgi:uncharacterized membrane protein